MNNPRIEWIRKEGRRCLQFHFHGKFSETEARTAVEEWRQIIAAAPEEQVILIWNCLEMNDYDQQARTLWQNACKEMKNRIEVIWVITNSILIRMGASVISVFSSLKIKVVGSEKEIRI
ncbi:MAG: hypothetical protein RBR09_09355 [Desulfobulbaceae bacterium]|nr:hypothetical protein [Desulfobulbaceae bacterium]MDY0351447.1 hypothetical protein [Desulfobulbaceae bacterium]